MTNEQRASATESALPNGMMSRRRLLTGIPAFGFVGSVAASVAPAAAETDTPVAIAYREWKAMRDFMHNETGDMPEAEFDALCDRSTAMERAMFELPNADIRDAALKLLAYTDGGRDFAEDGYGTGFRLLREMGEMIEGAA